MFNISKLGQCSLTWENAKAMAAMEMPCKSHMLSGGIISAISHMSSETAKVCEDILTPKKHINSYCLKDFFKQLFVVGIAFGILASVGYGSCILYCFALTLPQLFLFTL